MPLDPSLAVSNANVSGQAMNNGMATVSQGMPDTSSILGSFGSLLGTGLSAGGQIGAYNQLQQALQTIGPTALQSWNLSGPGGMGAGFNPTTGAATTSLGGLNGAFGNLTNVGTFGSGNYNSSLLPDLLNGSSGIFNPALGNLNNAFSGNQLFQGAAAQQAGGLNNTYNTIYGNTLANMRAQAAPQIQQQAYGLQNSLFGNGMADSTGAASGALAAQNFGRGVAQGDASIQLAAQQAAQSGMANQAGIAGTLSNTGNNLINSAFGTFGNTNQLLSGLNTQQLTNALSGIQGAGALNTLGLNNLQAATGLGAAQATARNQSLFPYASVANSLSQTVNPLTTMGGLLTGNGTNGNLFGNLFNMGKNAYNYFSGAGSNIPLGGFDFSGIGSGAVSGDVGSVGSLLGDGSSLFGPSAAGGEAAAAGAGAPGTMLGAGPAGQAVASYLGGASGDAATTAQLGAMTGADLNGSAATGAAAGAGSALGGMAGLGIGGAILAAGMLSPEMQLDKSYWQGLSNSLSAGPSSGTNVVNGVAQGPDFKAAAYQALQTPQGLVPPQIQQQLWASGIVPYGQWGVQALIGNAPVAQAPIQTAYRDFNQ